MITTAPNWVLPFGSPPSRNDSIAVAADGGGLILPLNNNVAVAADGGRPFDDVSSFGIMEPSHSSVATSPHALHQFAADAA
jgi:hypothetical protein